MITYYRILVGDSHVTYYNQIRIHIFNVNMPSFDEHISPCYNNIVITYRYNITYRIRGIRNIGFSIPKILYLQEQSITS